MIGRQSVSPFGRKVGFARKRSGAWVIALQSSKRMLNVSAKNCGKVLSWLNKNFRCLTATPEGPGALL